MNPSWHANTFRITGGRGVISHKGPVIQSFDVFISVHSNKSSGEHRSCRSFMLQWWSCNVNIIDLVMWQVNITDFNKTVLQIPLQNVFPMLVWDTMTMHYANGIIYTTKLICNKEDCTKTISMQEVKRPRDSETINRNTWLTTYYICKVLQCVIKYY